MTPIQNNVMTKKRSKLTYLGSFNGYLLEKQTNKDTKYSKYLTHRHRFTTIISHGQTFTPDKVKEARRWTHRLNYWLVELEWPQAISLYSRPRHSFNVPTFLPELFKVNGKVKSLHWGRQELWVGTGRVSLLITRQSERECVVDFGPID